MHKIIKVTTRGSSTLAGTSSAEVPLSKLVDFVLENEEETGRQLDSFSSSSRKSQRQSRS